MRPEQSPGAVLDNLISRSNRSEREYEAISALLERMAQSSVAQTSVLTSLNTRIAELIRAVSALHDKQELLDELSKQQTALSEEHFTSRVLEPTARRLLPLIDITAEPEKLDESVPSLCESVHTQLLEVLGALGVEPINPRVGALFDPRFMRPSNTRQTNCDAEERTVAQCTRRGFTRNGQVVRVAEVTIYKYEPEPQSIVKEGSLS